MKNLKLKYSSKEKSKFGPIAMIDRNEFLKYNIYPDFRPYQYETINKIVEFIKESPKRYIVIQAPTGSGKSILGYVVARWCQEHLSPVVGDKCGLYSSFLLTSKNLLLDQYDRDFHKHMAMVKGKANYQCLLSKGSAAEGLCSAARKNYWPCRNQCPYLVAIKKAQESPIMSTNLHLLLVDHDVAHRFNKRSMLIIDECHDVESVIMEYRTIVFTDRTIDEINEVKQQLLRQGDPKKFNRVYYMAHDSYIKTQGSKHKSYDVSNLDITNKLMVDKFLEDVKKDINVMRDVINNQIDLLIDGEYCGNQSEAAKDDEIKSANRFNDHMKDLSCKINNYFKEKDDTDWVVEEHITEKTKKITGFEMKPLNVKKLAKNIFTQFGNKVIMMSATVGGIDMFCENLGIEKDDVDYIEVPSTFPIENRPFVILPIAKMNYSNMEQNMPKIVQAVDDILETMKGKKGIIHSVSFKNAIYIKEHSRYANRIIIHDSKTKEKRLKEFKSSKDKVLVSPSLIEGFDFKGNMSEFQIFIKVPYRSLSSKVVRRRMEQEPDWYQNYAALSIMQGVGRSIRSETDQAVTFCLDDNINYLLSRYRYLFSEDFLKTIVRSE